MMGVAFLDHHEDAAAKLPIDGLDGGGIGAEERIEGAADLKNRDVCARQGAQPLKRRAFHGGIVGIDARDLAGIGGAPAIFEDPAPAHADEDGFLRQSVLVGEDLLHSDTPGLMGCSESWSRTVDRSIYAPIPARSSRSKSAQA